MQRRNFIKNIAIGSALTTLPLSCGTPGSNQKRTNGFPQNVNRALNNFEKRRKLLINNTAGQNITAADITKKDEDLYSNRAMANLLLNRHIEAANQKIIHTANWWDHPHPKGRDHKGENDFAAIKLCRAYYHFQDNDLLYPETRREIEQFFLEDDFKSHHGSENHVLKFRVCRYLMSHVFPEKVFQAYGEKGKVYQKEDCDWLKDYIRFRAKKGWGEFDSSCYYAVDWYILLTLFDYAPDKALKHFTEMMLDLLLADMTVDSLEGMYCGAHGRIYPPHALDHANELTFPIQYLYLGNISDQDLGTNSTYIELLASGYRPKPLLVDLALNRKEAYENLERKHLHNTEDVKPENPLPGSIRKYTYWTPQFAMGCVQLQDAYPADSEAKWYAHHEQHQWGLSFAGSTKARIFTHHPGKRGNEHNYWTGDLDCGCGHFFQSQHVLICLYDIPEDEPYQMIHAYLPQDEFDEVTEEKGFIFIRKGKVYTALKLLGGHEWTMEGEWKNQEVISPGNKNGAICEVGLQKDFVDFATFQEQILSNPIGFNPENMTLDYLSKQAGAMKMDTHGKRTINDNPVDLDYPSFKNPYMNSKWNSGLINIEKGGHQMKLDFRK